MMPEKHGFPLSESIKIVQVKTEIEKVGGDIGHSQASKYTKALHRNCSILYNITDIFYRQGEELSAGMSPVRQGKHAVFPDKQC